MRKRSKYKPPVSYFYLARHLAKFMMRLSYHVGPVRKQMTNTQNMDISEMNTQKIPNLTVCSYDKRESKRIKPEKNLSRVCSTDEIESKVVIVNACS